MEESSLFLTKLIGIYLVILGVLMFARRKFFMLAIRDFIKDRSDRFIIPVIELVAGIALVLAHNVWVKGPEVVVTIVGWMMVVESVFYLALPEKKVTKWLSAFNHAWVYLIAAPICVALGIYLLIATW